MAAPKIVNRNYISAYWKEIESGSIVVSAKVKMTMTMLMDVVNGNDPKYHFDPILANRPIYFVETFCKQSKEIGRAHV